MTYVAPIGDNFGITVTASSYNQFNVDKRLYPRYGTESNLNYENSEGFADVTNPWLNRLWMEDSPRMSHRHSASVRLDYQPWRGHVFSATLQASVFDSTTARRQLRFQPRRPEDWGPDYVIGEPGQATMRQIITSLDRTGDSQSGNLRWRFDRGGWNITAHVAHSQSDAALESIENGHFSEADISLNDSNQVSFLGIDSGGPSEIIVRDSDGESVDFWRMENYTLEPGGTPLEVKAGGDKTRREVTTYKADVYRELDFIRTDWFAPAIKTGFLREEETVQRSGRGAEYSYQYVGPHDAFVPEIYTDTSYVGVSPGYGLPHQEWLDVYELYDFFRANPSYWSDDTDDTTNQGQGDPGEYQSMAARNYISQATNDRNITEIRDAWYAQLEARLFHRLTLIGGMREESAKRRGHMSRQDATWNLLTNPDGSVYTDDPWLPDGIDITNENHLIAHDPDLLADAGIEPFDSLVTRGSLEAAQLQNTPRVPVRDASPSRPAYSFHAAYDITERLVARAAWARTHGRIDYEDGILAQTRIFNDPQGGGSIRVGNPDLEPWIADNWDFSLAYYTDAGGKFSVSYFVKDVDNFHFDQTFFLEGANYEEILNQFGIVPLPTMGQEDWTLSTTLNLEEVATTKGWEFEVNQSLDFLGDFASRFYVFANYTMKQFSASHDITEAMGATSDDFATGGFYYRGPRFSFRLNATWRDDNIDTTTGARRLMYDASGSRIGETFVFRYEPAEIRYDVSAAYSFAENYETFVNVRNLTGVATERKIMTPDGTLPSYASTSDRKEFGIQWMVGVRRVF